MSYITCPMCGGGLPGLPCTCSPRPFMPHVPPPPLPAQAGWSCPKCSRVWAPHVDQCRACNPMPNAVGTTGAGEGER